MKIFLLDLWHDLRQKRLWPVALALAVALVAVPVVLSKPAPEPPPPSPEPAEQRSEQDLKGLAKVVLANEDSGKGSKLNLFDPSNPFKPPKSVTDKAEDDSATDDTGAPSTGGDSVGESVSGGSLGGLPSGGGIGGAPTPTPTPTPTEPQQPAKPKTTQYTYVIDLTFRHNDDKSRRIKGMQRLEMLPNEDAPLLLFLGVDAKANNAVFLVDSSLTPTGEGRCKPSADDCSFLYLGAGSEEVFTDPDGNTYTLQIQEIRKVKVNEKKAKAKAGKNKRARRQAKTSQYDRKSAEQERRPFVPQLLTDLVSVTENPSSAAGASR